ncbi:MAG: polyprenyl synthetase family protein [Deltaproteobacteria bacterium]|nr:polyprenyl synthetase family protein [Deltaproteobacteria bacterium]
MSREALAALESSTPNDQALDWAKGHIEQNVFSGLQRDLLASLIDHFPRGEKSPYLEIPSLILKGCGGETELAVPLTALGSFLFLGFDIIDDIADGDARDHWPDHTLSELQLGSSLLLSALPSILIAELNAPEAVRVEIQKRFANGLLETAAGQQMELAMTGKTEIDPQKVEDSVKKKSSGIATLASIAVLLAKATENQRVAYEEMGRNLGCAIQLATDFHDLFQAPVSRDLRNGTRTLPIALCLEKCSKMERRIFLKLLDDVQSNPSKKEEIRSFLYSKGIARMTAFIVELYCERARKSLNLACLEATYQKEIDTFINLVSFFKEKGGNHELRIYRQTDR